MSTEPRDVGPLFGGDRPIQDADRHLVVNLLNAAYGDGRISEYELQVRMQYIYRARTFDDLVPIARDLMN